MTNPRIYQALVIAKALVLYSEHGIKANRMYTPKAMMMAATKITGQAFQPRDYMRAADALRKWTDANV